MRLVLALLARSLAVRYTWKGGAGTRNWEDVLNWQDASGGTGFPGATDEANIDGTGATAGPLVASSRAVTGLTLSGGGALEFQDGCDAGWLAPIGGGPVCFRAFSELLSWKDAEYRCQAFSSPAWHNCMARRNRTAATDAEHPNLSRRAGDAAAVRGLPQRAAEQLCAPLEDANLAQIGGDADNEIAHEVCRGLGADERLQSCWIGLTDNVTEGRWQWSDRSGAAGALFEPRYRAWARGEPSRSGPGVSHALEHCAAMRSHSVAGDGTNEGDWEDLACALGRPFVCQKPASRTTAHTLTVTGALSWTGGRVSGRGTLALTGGGVLGNAAQKLELARARLHATGAGQTVTWAAGDVAASDGARLLVDGGCEFRLAGHGTLETTAGGAITVFEVGHSAQLHQLSNPAAAGTSVLHARLVLHRKPAAAAASAFPAQLAVRGAGDRLELHGGGVAQAGTAIEVSALTAGAGAPTAPALVLRGAQFHMSTVSVQRVETTAARQVLPQLGGHFQLTFGANSTGCLAHHATAVEVEDALNALPAVRAAGYVKVRREGDGSAGWRFGYAYTIALDRSHQDPAAVEQITAASGACADVYTPATAGITMVAMQELADPATASVQPSTVIGQTGITMHVSSPYSTAGEATVACPKNTVPDPVPGNMGCKCEPAAQCTFWEISGTTCKVTGTTAGLGIRAVARCVGTFADSASDVVTQHTCPSPLTGSASMRCIGPFEDSTAVHVAYDPTTEKLQPYSTSTCRHGFDPVPVCRVAVAFQVHQVSSAGVASIAPRAGEQAGSLEVALGAHLLPHELGTPLRVIGGSAVVSATSPRFAGDVEVHGGVLALVGQGFEGIDAAHLLHAPADYRGRDSSALLAPPVVFAEAASNVVVAGGELQVLGAASSFRVSGVGGVDFRGGTLSGPCTMTADSRLSLSTAGAKNLKNGFELISPKHAHWTEGDLIGSEGALLVNEGLFTMAPGGNFLRGTDTPARSWHNGWYPNPVCVGRFCSQPPVMSNEGMIRKMAGSDSRASTSRFECTFDNNGLVEVLNGLVVLDGNGTLTGEGIVAHQPLKPAVAPPAPAPAHATAAANASSRPNIEHGPPGMVADASMTHSCVCGEWDGDTLVPPQLVQDDTSFLQLRFRTELAVPSGSLLRLHLPKGRYRLGAHPSVFFLSPPGARGRAYWADAIEPVRRSVGWTEAPVTGVSVECPAGTSVKACRCIGWNCKNQATLGQRCEAYAETFNNTAWSIKAEAHCILDSDGNNAPDDHVLGIKMTGVQLAFRQEVEVIVAHQWNMPTINLTAGAAGAGASVGSITLPRFEDDGIGAPDGIFCNATAVLTSLGVTNFTKGDLDLDPAPYSGRSVLVQCPKGCVTRLPTKVDPDTEEEYLDGSKELFGGHPNQNNKAQDFNPSGKTLPLYGVAAGSVVQLSSQVCLAAYHSTGQDGGMFKVTYYSHAQAVQFLQSQRRHGVQSTSGAYFDMVFTVDVATLNIMPELDRTLSPTCNKAATSCTDTEARANDKKCLYEGPMFGISYRSRSVDDYAIVVDRAPSGRRTNRSKLPHDELGRNESWVAPAKVGWHEDKAKGSLPDFMVPSASDNTCLITCRCHNKTETDAYVHPVITKQPVPVGSVYLPKFSAGFVLASPAAGLRFGAGSVIVDSNFFMGPGRVEFAAGRHTVLTSEFDAELVVSGGEVVFESPSFEMADANNREDARYAATSRHRFSLLGGRANFTSVAPQLIVHGNVLLAGGVLSFPRQAGLSREYVAKRGLVHVVNRLRWDGAVLDGNCDLKSGGGMGIGGGTKALKGLWRVINYGEAQWTAGDIVSDKGSAFVNRGTLESSGAGSARNAIDAHEQHRGPTQFVHAWA
eukprot:g1014.t1